VPVPSGAIPVEEVPVEEREHVDRGGGLAVVRKTLNLLGPGVKKLIQSTIGQNPLPAFDSPSDPSWKLMRAILLRWISESAVPVLIVPLPLYHYVEGISDATAYRARFRELAEAARVHLHDPLADILDLPLEQRRKMRFERDVHPTPFAHEVLAHSIARALAPLVTNDPVPA